MLFGVVDSWVLDEFVLAPVAESSVDLVDGVVAEMLDELRLLDSCDVLLVDVWLCLTCCSLVVTAPYLLAVDWFCLTCCSLVDDAPYLLAALVALVVA